MIYYNDVVATKAINILAEPAVCLERRQSPAKLDHHLIKQLCSACCGWVAVIAVSAAVHCLSAVEPASAHSGSSYKHKFC